MTIYHDPPWSVQLARDERRHASAREIHYFRTRKRPGLGEVMNSRRPRGGAATLAKIFATGDKRIDGHCPGPGKDLNAVSHVAGMKSDHESVSIEDMEQFSPDARHGPRGSTEEPRDAALPVRTFPRSMIDHG
jgi:hypothetical protein